MILGDGCYIVPTKPTDLVRDRPGSKETTWDCFEEHRFEARAGFLEGEAGHSSALSSYRRHGESSSI